MTNQQGDDRSNSSTGAESLSVIELPLPNRHLQTSRTVMPNMVIVNPSNHKKPSSLLDNSSPLLPGHPDVPSSTSSLPVTSSSQVPHCPQARSGEEDRKAIASMKSSNFLANLPNEQSYESDSDDDSELAASIEIAEEGEDGTITTLSPGAPRLLIIEGPAQSVNQAAAPDSSSAAVASMESETPAVSSEMDKNKSDMSTVIQVSLNGANTSQEDVKTTTTASTTASKTTVEAAQRSVVTSSVNGVAGHRTLSRPARSKQSAKVKQCFTTLQTFSNNMSRDVAEQVHELISALVVRLCIIAHVQCMGSLIEDGLRLYV